jgi:hypothetical protein
MMKCGIASLSLIEKVLRAECVAVFIALILFNSVLSPRYSVLMNVLTSIFDIHYSIFVLSEFLYRYDIAKRLPSPQPIISFEFIGNIAQV